jgi:hypothetical protein
MKLRKLIIHPRTNDARKAIADVVAMYDGVLTDVNKLGMKAYGASFLDFNTAMYCMKVLKDMPEVNKVLWDEAN